MECFEIVSAPPSYEIDREETVYGEFFVRVGTYAFPHENWGDLIASCLAMWIDSAVKLRRARIGRKIEFFFMDGPHYFVAEKRPGKEVRLTFYSYERPCKEVAVKLPDLLQQVSETAEQLLCHLREKQGPEYHTNELAHKLAALRACITDL